MSYLTSSETLTELRRYFDTFDAMQEAIGARRAQLYLSGGPLGSVAAALDLLREFKSDGHARNGA